MDEIARKIVKPAHVGGCIPDPSHPGLDIAQDGTSVVWDAHWIGMLNRGDILIVEAAEAEADESKNPQSPPAPKLAALAPAGPADIKK